MLLREVEYVRPSTVDEAVALLAAHDGARALAGGQTLRQRDEGAGCRHPTCSSTCATSTSCGTISFSDDESTLELGAMVTCSQIVASSEVEVARPVLAEVAATIADVQVRNRGTIGGNVCVNDPTNHFPPLLVALGAVVHDSSARTASASSRAHEFFLGVYTTAVGEGELLTKVSVPTRKPGAGDAMAGLTLGTHGTYVVSAAASRRSTTERASRSAVSQRHRFA